jgi:hypothetical protein
MMTLVPGSTVAVVGSNIDKSNNSVFFKKYYFSKLLLFSSSPMILSYEYVKLFRVQPIVILMTC